MTLRSFRSIPREDSFIFGVAHSKYFYWYSRLLGIFLSRYQIKYCPQAPSYCQRCRVDASRNVPNLSNWSSFTYWHLSPSIKNIPLLCTTNVITITIWKLFRKKQRYLNYILLATKFYDKFDSYPPVKYVRVLLNFEYHLTLKSTT